MSVNASSDAFMLNKHYLSLVQSNASLMVISVIENYRQEDVFERQGGTEYKSMWALITKKAKLTHINFN